jgi:hypothetical protein
MRRTDDDMHCPPDGIKEEAAGNTQHGATGERKRHNQGIDGHIGKGG